MNTPRRGNIYFLFLLVFQIIISILYLLLIHFTKLPLLSAPLMLIAIQILNLFIPFLIYFKATSQQITETLPMDKLNITNICLIIIFSLTVQPVMMALSLLSATVFQNNVSAVMREFYELPFTVIVFATAICPAILEEINLRGILLTNYSKVSIKKAAIINGLMFAILHLDLQQFLYAFLLGIIFAYFVYYTKSIFASILSHFTINFSQTLLGYISYKSFDASSASEALSTTLSQQDMLNSLISILVTAIIFAPVSIIIFGVIVRYNKSRIVYEELSKGL